LLKRFADNVQERIQRHLDAPKSNFREAGKLLMQIRDNKLYREIYGTFEEYCKEKWGFTKSRANQLISASEVADNLTTVVVKEIPERQLRPLTRIKDPAEQREVYQKAVETAPEGKITAKHIEETIKEVKKSKEPEKKEGEYKYTETYPVTDALIFAGFAISQFEGIRPDGPKRREGIRKVAALKKDDGKRKHSKSIVGCFQWQTLKRY
jgi:hypothetical protein